MKIKNSKTYQTDITVVGGCGHVGLPLAIAFANKGLNVSIYDTNETVVEVVNSGVMPFLEPGADEMLKKVIGDSLNAYSDPKVIIQSKYIIIIIGTPVDEYLNPNVNLFNKFISEIFKYLRDDQIIILRSTVFPGTAEWLYHYLKDNDKSIGVSFCPERIAEGKAMEELFSLPQIISAFDNKTLDAVDKLFSNLTRQRIALEPIQAELAKLFTNSWRYIQFAIANQFYMLASEYKTDFYKIFDAMRDNYPRTKGFPRAGFAAGPCLFKDTMQLSAFSNNRFFLGHSAMLINEGLPNFVVQKLKEKYRLGESTIGILGMAFKADSDDNRSSLSYKLRKILLIEAKEVLCHDVYIKDDTFVSLEEILNKSDIIILGAPHREYKEVTIPSGTHIVDIWNYYNNGGLI
jgi:UDP-N-acetyl-D-mannosaminuronic acid dehydrogenase